MSKHSLVCIITSIHLKMFKCEYMKICSIEKLKYMTVYAHNNVLIDITLMQQGGQIRATEGYKRNMEKPDPGNFPFYHILYHCETGVLLLLLFF